MPTQGQWMMTENTQHAELVRKLYEAALNLEEARESGITEYLAGWEHNVCRQAAHVLRTQPTTGWQPIENAPDGILLGFGTIEGDYGYTQDREGIVKTYRDEKGRWRFSQPMGRHDPVFWEPTHYMEIPKTPKRKTDSEMATFQ